MNDYCFYVDLSVNTNIKRTSLKNEKYIEKRLSTKFVHKHLLGEWEESATY